MVSRCLLLFAFPTRSSKQVHDGLVIATHRYLPSFSLRNYEYMNVRNQVNHEQAGENTSMLKWAPVWELYPLTARVQGWTSGNLGNLYSYSFWNLLVLVTLLVLQVTRNDIKRLKSTRVRKVETPLRPPLLVSYSSITNTIQQVIDQLALPISIWGIGRFSVKINSHPDSCHRASIELDSRLHLLTYITAIPESHSNS